MVGTDRFQKKQTIRQPELQPDSPVYVHCTRESVDKASGKAFVQIRLVNVADRPVRTVVVQLEGLDDRNAVLFVMREVVLAQCRAAPHRAFGEDKILSIPSDTVQRVRVTVERVVFEDGTYWRKQAGHGLVSGEEANWQTCVCGMRNPPDLQSCLLCGAPIGAEQMDEPLPFCPEEFSEIPVPYIEFPPQRFYSGTESEGIEPLTEEEPTPVPEERPMSAGLVALLCIFAVLALLAVTGFLTCCFMQYLGKI